MAATRGNDRRLSDEQLGELITLLKDVDTVELKLTVPQADQRAVVTGSRSTPSRRRSGRCSSSTRRISP